METIKATLTGKAPILLHNGHLVDPRNVFTREIDSAQKAYKKTKSDAAFDALAAIEWLGCLYTTEPIVFRREGNKVLVENDSLICIDGEMLTRCLVQSAGRREVAAFKAGVFCDGMFQLKVDGKGATTRRCFLDPRYQYTRPAKIGTSKIMRTRPRFDAWSVDVEVSFLPELVTRRDVEDALQRAGSIKGIGDWRPRFGRFTAVVK